jgi:PKD domain
MTFGQGENLPAPFHGLTILDSNLPDPSVASPGAHNIAYLPMRSFDGDVAYNVNEGLDIWKTFRGDYPVPVRSSFNNLTFWGIRNEGIFLEYASDVEIHNSLILGNPSNPINGVYQGVMMASGFGIANNGPPRYLLFQDVRIEGFRDGLEVPYSADNEQQTENPPDPNIESVLDGCYFANNINNLAKNVDASHNPMPFSKLFDIMPNNTFVVPAGSPPPVASFTDMPQGSLTMVFDGSSSSSPITPAIPMAGNKIAGYSWDFGDGTVGSGSQATHVYGKSGSYAVKLTVYDCMGNTATISQIVTLP